MAGNRPRMKDVAERAGVSVATVSHVVNQSGRVSIETADRVKQAIDELGFVRNEVARQLRSGISGTVGAIILDLANPYFTELARGLEDRLLENDCALMICSSDGNPERETKLMRLLVQHGVRGLMITPSASTVANLPLLERLHCPVVLMDARHEAADVATVGPDDVAGGQLAIEHLLSKGHRRIGMINDTHRLPHCQARWSGAIEAVRAVPGASLVEVFVAERGMVGGNEAFRRLRAARPEITAVFCFNDMAALGALTACQESGLDVPRDIAIVGYDDIQLAERFPVPLTSVHQPIREMGRRAGEILLQSRPELPHVVFTPHLVERAST